MKKNKNVKKRKVELTNNYVPQSRDYSSLPTPEIQKVFHDFVNDYMKGDDGHFDDERNNSTLEMVDTVYNTLYWGGLGSLEGFIPEIPTYNQLLQEKTDEFWEKVTNEDEYQERVSEFGKNNPVRQSRKLEQELNKDFPKLKKRTRGGVG